MVTADSGRLERVVVTANGALVTRHIPVAAGSRRLVVETLPLRLVDETLRIRPLTPGLQVGLVEERCVVEVTASERPRDEAALLEARIALLRLDQRRASLHVLRTIGAVDVELPPPEVAADPDAGALLELLEAADRRGTALLQLEQQLAHEHRAAEKTLRQLEHVARVDAAPPRVLRGIEAEVDGDGVVEVEYFVTAARWVPSYALHLHRDPSGARRARVVLGALVAQASGEDWNDVELRVTTSRLDRASTLPIVHSWRLGRAQPAVIKGFRPLPSDLPQLFSGWDRFGLEPELSPPPPPPPRAPEPAPAAVMKKKESRASPPPMLMAAPAIMVEKSRFEPEADEADDAELTDLSAHFDDVADVRRLSAPPTASRSMSSSGGAPGRPPPPVIVVDELPPRLRTSGLRMAFADEGPRRGLLLPMDMRARLAWLLDVADLSSDDADHRRAEVERAVDALENAEFALSARPFPPGTIAVDGQAARVFCGRGRSTIASDGHEHRFEVHSEDVAVAVVHHAVPRESLDVWRMAVLTPGGALPAGPVQVYDDGAFVVSGSVAGTAGQPMIFNLGVDPDVRIVSRTPHLQQAEKGLMGGTSQVEQRVVTIVRNSRAEPVRLTVFDRLPVVDDNVKDITVTLTSSQPPLQRTDRGPDDAELQGGVRAVVTVMPDDTMRLEHSYLMTLPAKMEVVGGNRRE